MTQAKRECWTCWICNVTVADDLENGGHFCATTRKPQRIDEAIEAVSPRHAGHDVQEVRS